MATTAELDELDQAHRVQQATNAAALVLALNETWQQLDPANLAAAGGQWLVEAISLIRTRRQRSGALALSYARDIRELQIGLDGFVLPGVPDPIEAQIRESMLFTGLKLTAYELSMIPGRREALRVGEAEALREDAERVGRENISIDQQVAETMKRAQTRVAMAAVRHTNNGARDAIDEIVRTDKKALGFIRITRLKCCGFCAMLASRGPVYAEDSFDESNARFDGPGDHKVHDECGCMLRPAYTRDGSEWTDVAREASQLWEVGNPTGWDVATQGPYRSPANLSTAKARTEFRRIWRLRNATIG